MLTPIALRYKARVEALTSMPIQLRMSYSTTLAIDDLKVDDTLLLRLNGPEASRNQNKSSSSVANAKSSTLTDVSTTRPTGKFLKPNFGNDYSTEYIHTNVLPQARVQNIEDCHAGYPRLQKLHQLKEQHNREYAASPVSLRIPVPQIRDFVMHVANSNARFDVIMLHGCIEPFPLEQLQQLSIDRIASRPSLLYLWCPTSQIGNARLLMEKWGVRRAEDITFMVSSRQSPYAPYMSPWAHPGNPSPNQQLFQQTTWHCLMGLRGTLRRSTDFNLINCNIDTDVIIEKSHSNRGVVPEEIYRLIENFTSMGRKIHIIPSISTEQLPVRPRPGWVIVSPDAFNMGTFKYSAYKSRTIQPMLDEVENLRPRTPPTRK